MKRPIFIASIGSIIGIIMGLYFKFSIVLLYLPIFAIYYIIKNLKIKRKFKILSFKRYFRYLKIFINFKGIILLSISSIIFNSVTLYQNNKYESLYKENENIELIGVIISNKEEKEYNDKYCLKVNSQGKYKGTKLYLNVNKKVKLEYGDKIKIKGVFIEPEVRRNYGGFSYKEYLKTLKIYGTIKVEKIEIINKNQVNIILTSANKIKINIEEKIDKLMDKEQSSIFKGLILGNTSYIEEEIQENFRTSNISHVLAVSGMHVSYIISGINLCFKNLLGKRKVKFVIIFILIAYMFITGFSPSIVRATIMGLIATLSGIVHRKNDVWTSISFSLFLLIIQNPFVLTSIGLQLSYLGTIGIILFYSKVLNLLKKISIKNSKIKEILSVTISAQIVILPVMLYHFNLLGTYFLITNLLVSIIIGPIIVLGVIVVLLYPISESIVFIISIGIDFLQLISKIAEFPLSKIYLPTPNIFMIILYYILLVALDFIYSLYSNSKLSITQRRFRNLIALFKYKIWINKKLYLKNLILSIIVISVILLSFTNNLKIHFVDVGQGDCTFIVTPKNKTILIDGGGSLSDKFDVGKKTLLPYILDRGYTQIDYIFISHFDEDHVEGILTILKEFKVGQVFISKQIEDSENYQKFLEIVKEKKIKVKQVKAKDRIFIEKNLYFDVIWPNKNQISENPLNNNSIVCKLNYKDFSMLFTGDIEEIAEKEILKNISTKQLKVDILKVAHHGSKTSSIQEFIKAVQPKIAVIGVGKNNNFGHPDDNIITRISNLRCKNL